MKQIAMIALHPLDHGGTTYEAGQRFDVAPVEALMLSYRKRARFATRHDPVARIEEPVVEPVRTRRRYKRRDLKAEGE